MITTDLDRVLLRSGDRVLDIGCGTGRHTCAVYQKADVVAVGVDLNRGELREAKSRLELHDRLGLGGGGKWGFCVANTLRLPFARASFDLVVCSEVLEHVHDHRSAVAEVARVLKPGRHLVVSVPRYWPEKICWSISKSYALQEGGHVRIYRKRDLVDIIADAGFKLFYTHYAHSLHTPYWWLKCLVGPERGDHPVVGLYHRFLLWDIMQRPRITDFVDRLFNPVFGKSVVLYFAKCTRTTETRSSQAQP